MKYRLKDNHPAMEALNELWNKADELGIKIYISRAGRTIIAIGEKEFELQDIEDPNYPMIEFPPGCEFKLTYKKEE